jgi:hypothetical protein
MVQLRNLGLATVGGVLRAGDSVAGLRRDDWDVFGPDAW